jgi:hypothetical protein
VQFRSLHSLVRRALAAGAASALALTLFNAVQPTLHPHKIGPGTVEDVPITLVGRERAAARAANAAPRAKAAAAGTGMVSAPVKVGKARFVGFSWPAPAAGPRAGGPGRVWLRARTAAGWSGWREVEPAADGPDATSPEYHPSDRVYSDGQWLDAGTTDLQVRVDPPAAPANASGSGAPGPSSATAGATAAGGPQAGVEAHLITRT